MSTNLESPFIRDPTQWKSEQCHFPHGPTELHIISNWDKYLLSQGACARCLAFNDFIFKADIKIHHHTSFLPPHIHLCVLGESFHWGSFPAGYYVSEVKSENERDFPVVWCAAPLNTYLIKDLCSDSIWDFQSSGTFWNERDWCIISPDNKKYII